MPARVPGDRKKKQDTQDKYAATSWGINSAEYLEDLRVPSGQLCQVRRPGVEGLVNAGVLNDIDSLTALVDQKHLRRVQGRPQVDVNALALDEQNLKNILNVVNRVVCYVVVQPQIQLVPEDGEREQGVIYVDSVQLEDKMFILNYAVGGTRDLERFRRELDESVRSVEIVTDVDEITE